MNAAGIVFAAVFYAAAAVFILGLAYRIRLYAGTPAPLKIPTTPAPTTGTGVVFRLARETVFFESLFKASLWTWLFGWAFHAALFLVVLRHTRYFIEPLPGVLAFIQPFGVYAGFVMVLGLAGLWARRVFVDRVRYISTPSDHLMLALLIAIGLSGLGMKYLVATDVVMVKAFFTGLYTFSIQPLPSDPLLFVHLGLVAALMIIFPYSKLLHGPGLYFSPTRNQADDPRERRHIAAWAARMESER